MSRVQTGRAKLESMGEGRFRVCGILDAGTVTGVLAESDRRFAGVSDIVVNLSLVTESDSSGLALLLQWMQQARRDGVKIHFQDVPQQIMALARISEVDDLLMENGSVTATPEDNEVAQA